MKSKLFKFIKTNNLKRSNFVNELLNTLPVDKKHILNYLSLKEHNISLISNFKTDNILNIILLNNTNDKALLIDIDLNSLKVTTNFSVNGNIMTSDSEENYLNKNELLDIRSLLLKVTNNLQ